MDGKSLLRYGTEALGGIAIADQRFFFDCLDEAATSFVRETKSLTAEAVLTTVANHQAYKLPPDFIALIAKDRAGKFIVRYTNTDSEESYITHVPFDTIFRFGTQDVGTPESFCLVQSAPESVLAGTATATGELYKGESILSDETETFTETVQVRDAIRNGSDGSDGFVTAVISDTQVRVVLFGGTSNVFQSGDDYEILSAADTLLKLDKPSEVADETLTVPYLKKPSPVYSESARWELNPQSCRAICFEAAFLFKSDFDFDYRRDAQLHERFVQEINRVKAEQGRHKLHHYRNNDKRTMGYG